MVRFRFHPFRFRFHAFGFGFSFGFSFGFAFIAFGFAFVFIAFGFGFGFSFSFSFGFIGFAFIAFGFSFGFILLRMDGWMDTERGSIDRSIGGPSGVFSRVITRQSHPSSRAFFFLHDVTPNRTEPNRINQSCAGFVRRLRRRRRHRGVSINEEYLVDDG